MKTIKILFICMITTIVVNAQSVPPYTLSDVEVTPPQFSAEQPKKGTSESINSYIAENFVYPEFDDLPHEGTEVVQFLVSTEGTISEINIINSVSIEVDKEIIRVLNSTDNMWKAGQHNGNAVAMEKEIAVTIKVGSTFEAPASRDFGQMAENHYKKGAKKLLIKKKTRQALHHFETALRYQPYDRSVLTMMALCEIELGKQAEAQQHIARIQELGGIETQAENLAENIETLESYPELMQLLAANQ